MIWVVLLIYVSDLLSSQAACAQSLPPVAVDFLPSTISSAPILKAISLDQNDQFKINFLVDSGRSGNVDESQSRTLIKYFLTFLTIPEKDLWVNLSPAEPDRIVNADFGVTATATDMLRQDYLLKQLAASMTNPDHDLGKKFWEQVTARVRKEYGDIDIPLDTVNKVWIVPESAVVYEKEGAAFISESHLKVMLDEDYWSMKKIAPDHAVLEGDSKKVSGLCSDLVREVIVPEIEREVNEGPTFAELRQMYHALILAIWFKRHLKGSIVNKVYADQKKIAGIETSDHSASQQIYEQYLAALKQGVYNMIREEYDPEKQEVIPRKYFSGGFSFEDAAQKIDFRPASSFGSRVVSALGSFFRLTFSLVPQGVSKKILLGLLAAAPFIASAHATAFNDRDGLQTPHVRIADVSRSAGKSLISDELVEPLERPEEKARRLQEDQRGEQVVENRLRLSEDAPMPVIAPEPYH
ncbi:MAG: hypothetical protein HQL18_02530, partial [Candidatus Omnitrophica bacterium]|nr:hypothetical protein [Candidatus Omnitrophota bacterium]